MIYLNNNKKILINSIALMAFCSLSMYVYTPFSYAIALSIDGLSDSPLSQLKSLLLDEVKAKQNHTNHSND